MKLRIYDVIEMWAAEADLDALMKRLKRLQVNPSYVLVGRLPDEVLRLFAALAARHGRLEQIAFEGMDLLLTAALAKKMHEVDQKSAALMDEVKALEEEAKLLDMLFMREVQLQFPEVVGKCVLVGPGGQIYTCQHGTDHG